MSDDTYILFPRDAFSFIGVVLGPSLGGKDELHGPFADAKAARDFATKMFAEYEDYQYCKIIRVEMPAA